MPLAIGFGLVFLAAFIAYVDQPRDLPAAVLAALYAVVISAGLVGMDVLNGSVHLLLTRPITRNGYLAGRFLGALTVSGTVCVSMYGAVALAAMARGEGADTARILAAQAVTALAGVVWVSALMLLCSTFLPERGDVLGYLGIVVFGYSVAGIARAAGDTTLIAVAQRVEVNVFNMLPVCEGFAYPLSDVLRWSSNVACALTGAAVVFNRRELSYAAG